MTSRAQAVEPLDALLSAWGAHDRDNPYPAYLTVRAAGPVHPVTLADGHEAWLVVGYEEARAALNDPRLSKDMQAAFASADAVVAEGLPGPAYARHMLAVDPPDHTRLRRLVAGAFSMRRVEVLEPRVQEIVDDLLDALAARGPTATVDLVAGFAFPLPFTVICELLGVAIDDRAALGKGLTTMLAPTPTPEQWRVAKEASDTVMAMLAALVDQKRRDPRDDLVSALVAGPDGGEALEGDELLATIFQLIVAGHDTTTSLIGNSVVALLRHPDHLAQLRNDPSSLPAAVEELLRYDSPVPHATFRFTREPVTIGGRTIPEGTQVLISLAAGNRDPGRFPDADRLDLQRTDNRHLAFGHGIHFCLGAALARLEGRIALGSLLARFPELRLSGPDAALHWAHGDGLVLRGLSELPVVLGRPISA